MREIEKARGEIAIKTFNEEWAKSEMIDQTLVSGIKGAMISGWKTIDEGAKDLKENRINRKKEEI